MSNENAGCPIHGPECVRFVQHMLQLDHHRDELGLAIKIKHPELKVDETIGNICAIAFAKGCHDSYHALDQAIDNAREENEVLEEKTNKAVLSLSELIDNCADSETVSALRSILQPLAAEMHERSERKMSAFAKEVHSMTQVPMDLLTSTVDVDTVDRERLLRLCDKFSPILLSIYIAYDGKMPDIATIKMEDALPRIMDAMAKKNEGEEIPEETRIGYAKWVILNAREALASADDREAMFAAHEKLSDPSALDFLKKF